jgi:hypothetical protein
MKPSIGRIVHYVHPTVIYKPTPDAASLLEPGEPVASVEHRAAIVTSIHPDGGVSLFVLEPTGSFSRYWAGQDEDHHRSGSWHWPERE